MNILLGFVAIFLAMCGGFFVAFHAENAFIHDPSSLTSWPYTLLKSAHGHLTLFGTLHICMGLTMPYSGLSAKTKVVQSIGLFLGTVAMGGLMSLRALLGPQTPIDSLGLITGVFLSLATLSIVAHMFGLLLKMK